MKDNHLPFWALKLSTPAFWKPEKYQKMLKQWQWRRGLEVIKQRHALVHSPLDQDLKARQKAEIQGYLQWVRDQQDKDLLKDVYVTDNKPKTARYNVNNENELDAYIKY